MKYRRDGMIKYMMGWHDEYEMGIILTLLLPAIEWMISQEIVALGDVSLGDALQDGLPCEFGQFVGALQDSGDLDCSLPVGVVEALLVGELGQTLLGDVGSAAHHRVVRGSASTLCHLLSSQVEVKSLLLRKLVEDHATGSGITQLRGELALGTVAFGGIEHSRVDLGVHHDVNTLRLVVCLLRPLPHLLNHYVQSRKFPWHLCPHLCHAEALPVHHDHTGGVAVLLHVALGPSQEDGLIVRRGDVFLIGVSHDALVEDLRVCVVQCTHEGQSESLLAPGDGEGTMHGGTLVEVIRTIDFPPDSSDLAVHLQDDLGCSTEGVFGLAADGSASDALGGQFELTGDELLQWPIEPFFVAVEEKDNDLRLAVLSHVSLDLFLPALDVAVAGDEARLFELHLEGLRCLEDEVHKVISVVVVVFGILALGVHHHPIFYLH